MAPARAQASAALAIRVASVSFAWISLMMLLIAGSIVLRSMTPSVGGGSDAPVGTEVERIREQSCGSYRVSPITLLLAKQPAGAGKCYLSGRLPKGRGGVFPATKSLKI